jgi:hypothetical protein
MFTVAVKSLFTKLWDGVIMKAGSKILILMLGLMLPYMGFVLYRAFAYPQHPFPDSFLYVGPCYFFGSIALLMVLKKENCRRHSPAGPREARASSGGD